MSEPSALGESLCSHAFSCKAHGTWKVRMTWPMRFQWEVKNKFLALLAQPAEAPGVVCQSSRQTLPTGKQQPSAASWVSSTVGRQAGPRPMGSVVGTRPSPGVQKECPMGRTSGVCWDGWWNKDPKHCWRDLCFLVESFSIFLPLKFSVTSKLFFCGMRYMILLMLCPKANSKTTTTAYGSPTISMCQAPYYRSLKISPSALQKFLAPLEG